MDSLRALVTDHTFLANVFLLMLTGALTGFLVPVIKARWDDASAERKQVLQAELSRQAEFLQAQAELLGTFSDATWAFLFDAFKVSYAEAWEDEETQIEAWDVYTPLSWTHLGRIRAIISKSKRLIGDDCHRTLLATYDWLVQYDDSLAEFQVGKHPPGDWQRFHQDFFRQAAMKMDDTISHLANELRLSAGSESRSIGKGQR